MFDYSASTYKSFDFSKLLMPTGCMKDIEMKIIFEDTVMLLRTIMACFSIIHMWTNSMNLTLITNTNIILIIIL